MHQQAKSLSKLVVWLDALLEQSVELLYLARHRKIDRVAGKVDDQTALDSRVDLLNDLERLAVTLGGNLRALESRLDSRNQRLVERSSRGDGDLDFTTVGSHEVLESLDDLFGVGQTAVLGEHGEEVAVVEQRRERCG